MQRSFLLVRKYPSHGAYWAAEGWLGRRWIFFDDTIDTGATLEHVKERIKEIRRQRNKWRTTFVGAYLYVDAFGPWLPSGTTYRGANGKIII